MKFIQIGTKSFIYDDVQDEMYVRVADMDIGRHYEPSEVSFFFNGEHYASFTALADEFRVSEPEHWDRYKKWILRLVAAG